METIALTTWNEYRPAVQDISLRFGKHRQAQREVRNVILFRGQADASWPLRTTLERFSKRTWSVRRYAELALRCGPQLESFTDRNWDLLERGSLGKWFESFEPNESPLPDYGFWIYLRQHGFPSPLLDWTESPYVAAFFAAHEQIESERRAVYAYIEMPEGSKGTYRGSTTISVQGPYVRADRRHFLQQSWYTICTKLDQTEYDFAPHEHILGRRSSRQDVLVKITIPSSERLAMLADLQQMNINWFSLFQSEDSLVRTLAYEKIERHEAH